MEQAIETFKDAIDAATNGGFEDGLSFFEMAEMLRQKADEATD